MFNFTDKSKLLDSLNRYMQTIGKIATANQLDILIDSHAKAIKLRPYTYDVQIVDKDGKYTFYPINSPDFIAFVKFLQTDSRLDYALCVGYAVAIRGMVKTGIISGEFATPLTSQEQKEQTDNKIKFYAVTAIAVLGLIFLIK